MSAKTALKVFGLTCLVLLIIEVLFDPFSYVANAVRIEQIRRELPIAKARWQAQEITDYKVKVRGGNMPCLFMDAQLTIQQGRLVSAVTRARPFDETSPMIIPITAAEWDACHYNDLAMAKMFERIEQDLQRIDPTQVELIVAFDATAGYVSNYALNYGIGIGILSNTIADGRTGYEFRDFQVIARNTQSNWNQSGDTSYHIPAVRPTRRPEKLIKLRG